MNRRNKTPLFYYVIEIQDREFLIAVMSDRMSYWDDHTERRRIRHPRHQHLEHQSFAGDRQALQRLFNEEIEFTVPIAVSEKIFLKILQIVGKQRWEETGEFPKITWGTIKDVAEMDQLLSDFFWQKINPSLGHPLKLQAGARDR